jgi:glutamate formiminotransferase
MINDIDETDENKVEKLKKKQKELDDAKMKTLEKNNNNNQKEYTLICEQEKWLAFQIRIIERRIKGKTEDKNKNKRLIK